ncbi:MAG: ABC transporter permease [Myxococcales bacterium]|nr:ABC transporter permease [Myxococcales bacterium]
MAEQAVVDRTRAWHFAIAIAAALLLGSLLILLAQVSPASVWQIVLIEPWLSWYGLGQVIAKATPLLCTGLAVWIARHAGLLNLGAEAQLAAGCVTYAVLGASGLPPWLALATAITGAALAGAAIGAIIGAMKASRGANEIVVAIALNAVVLAGIMALGHHFLFVGVALRSETTQAATWMPSLGLGQSQANVSALVALVLAIASGYVMHRTKLGFEIRLLGQRRTVAAAAGIGIVKTTCLAMAWAGAAAGLGALHYVGGYKHAFEAQMGAGMGMLGIAVALLGGRTIPGLVASAIVFGALLHGGLLASRLVPKEIIETSIAMLVLALAAASIRQQTEASDA